MLTSKTKMMSIRKQGGPEESTTGIRATKGQNTMNFTLRDTSMLYLVWIMLEKIRAFLIVISYL